MVKALPKTYERDKPFLPNRDIQHLPLGMRFKLTLKGCLYSQLFLPCWIMPSMMMSDIGRACLFHMFSGNPLTI